jgi:hypothetical protein
MAVVIKPAAFRPPQNTQHSTIRNSKLGCHTVKHTVSFIYIYIYIYVCIYIYTYIGIGQKLSFTIFGGMNIYLPTILITRGRGFWPPILNCQPATMSLSPGNSGPLLAISLGSWQTTWCLCKEPWQIISNSWKSNTKRDPQHKFKQNISNPKFEQKKIEKTFDWKLWIGSLC